MGKQRVIKQQANNQVVPIDIRKIRQVLQLTMKDMGQLIAIYSKGMPCTPIPMSRVNEWEFDFRPIPAYVYTACAKILLDYWAEDRHIALPLRQREVDVYYGTVLNPPLGSLFRLELELSRSRRVQHHNLAKDVRKARLSQMRYLETMLGVRMSYVFTGCGPVDDDLEMVA